MELLETSGAGLYALLTRVTLREDVAEELMQELFIKLSNVRDPENVENWNAYAYRAAINLAFDWRRKQKHASVSLERVREPVSGERSPLDGLIHNEQLEEVLDGMGRLNDTPRQALVMRYIQQESYEYIAEQMGKTPHHVRALCSRALGHLREILGSNQPPSSSKEANDVEH
jgi:RNA polymerase sigma factor (sigma-70 family)